MIMRAIVNSEQMRRNMAERLMDFTQPLPTADDWRQVYIATGLEIAEDDLTDLLGEVCGDARRYVRYALKGVRCARANLHSAYWVDDVRGAVEELDEGCRTCLNAEDGPGSAGCASLGAWLEEVLDDLELDAIIEWCLEGRQDA